MHDRSRDMSQEPLAVMSYLVTSVDDMDHMHSLEKKKKEIRLMCYTYPGIADKLYLHVVGDNIEGNILSGHIDIIPKQTVKDLIPTICYIHRSKFGLDFN